MNVDKGLYNEPVVLKISGECMTKDGFGIDDNAHFIAGEIDRISPCSKLAIIIGGGNFAKGSILTQTIGIRRVVADIMGMLGTIQNALALQEILEQRFKRNVRVMSSITVNQIPEPYIIKRMLSHIAKMRVVILAGGDGNPGSSSDHATVTKAVEMDAKWILKGTKVDGIFSEDPAKYSEARFIPRITHDEFIKNNLDIMDITAVIQARDRNINIRIFNIFKRHNLSRIMQGEEVGSVIATSP